MTAGGRGRSGGAPGGQGRSGDGVAIRRATYLDNAALAALYRSLDERSRALRFSGAVTAADLAEHARLGPEDAAVVALEGRVVLGEARYVMAAAGPPELAMAVTPAAQGRGLGARLLEGLRGVARTEGVLTLRGIVRADNLAMVSLLQRVATLVNAPTDEGDLVFDLACDDLMAPWPRRAGGTRVLVESPDRLEPGELRELVDAGVEVRQCLGPNPAEHRRCPALTDGRCRLVEGADVIVALLPDDPPSRELMAAHQARQDHRVVASAHEWRSVAHRLAGGKPTGPAG